MKQFYLIALFSFALLSCQSQTNGETSSGKVGGPCEGCEGVYDYGDRELKHSDTLPEFHNEEPKLKIKGRVFRQDETTPAAGVILYIYHTNREGIYPKKGDEVGMGKRHGYIRGWVKTNQNGEYEFYTFRPASYPNRREPEHIHLTVKETDKNEYYLEDYLFEDDSLLTTEKRSKLRNRGGSGVVMPEMRNGILTIERDIILGLNIPDYD